MPLVSCNFVKSSIVDVFNGLGNSLHANSISRVSPCIGMVTFADCSPEAMLFFSFDGHLLKMQLKHIKVNAKIQAKIRETSTSIMKWIGMIGVKRGILKFKVKILNLLQEWLNIIYIIKNGFNKANTNLMYILGGKWRKSFSDWFE